MLSKSLLYLLGMIKESLKVAYEITKKMEQMSVRKWRLSDATVYSTIHSIEKKN